MVSTHTLFEWLVGLHIATGTVGLAVLWIPIAGKKGGALHRRVGRGGEPRGHGQRGRQMGERVELGRAADAGAVRRHD